MSGSDDGLPGVAMAVAAISALTGRPVDGATAVTGEIGVQGLVRPVGGVPAKVEAARRAGLSRVILPRENDNAAGAYCRYTNCIDFTHCCTSCSF